MAHKVCVVCGTEFETPTPRLTCSPECAAAHKSRTLKAARVRRFAAKSPEEQARIRAAQRVRLDAFVESRKPA